MRPCTRPPPHMEGWSGTTCPTMAHMGPMGPYGSWPGPGPASCWDPRGRDRSFPGLPIRVNLVYQIHSFLQNHASRVRETLASQTKMYSSVFGITPFSLKLDGHSSVFGMNSNVFGKNSSVFGMTIRVYLEKAVQCPCEALDGPAQRPWRCLRAFLKNMKSYGSLWAC